MNNQSQWDDTYREEDERSLEKNLTDVDSADLERELNIAKVAGEEDSLMSPGANYFSNYHSRQRLATLAGIDRQTVIQNQEGGFGDFDYMSENDNPILPINRSNNNVDE